MQYKETIAVQEAFVYVFRLRRHCAGGAALADILATRQINKREHSRLFDVHTYARDAGISDGIGVAQGCRFSQASSTTSCKRHGASRVREYG